jgi:hypothetical protein
MKKDQHQKVAIASQGASCRKTSSQSGFFIPPEQTEVFAKKIGFKEFQLANKNFEYRLIFDASLQKRQQELLENITKLEK